MKIQGKVHKYGDHVDTDVIIPARYLNSSDPKDLAAHCMEDIDSDFVDVRSAEEFAEKSVEGSVNIPVDTIEEGLSAYSKDTVLIFYCSAGSRAEKALKTAKEMGFTNVYNLGSIDKLI